jgi:hypothetical protein
MATPKPTHSRTGKKLTPYPSDDVAVLDPETDEFDDADITGLEFSEATGEWFDPAIEDAEEATGML